MILVDAGVLIDYLRSHDARLMSRFRSEPAAICGVTRAEVLAGARGATDHQRLLQFLSAFPPITTPETCWDALGANLADLLAHGITVPFPDAVVATLGIENDLEVWARDAHFARMKVVLTRLKLFQEPP